MYDSNSNLYTYVNAYANKMAIATGISISGKIMSYEQAMSLSTDMRKDLNNHYYWLGSAVGWGGGTSHHEEPSPYPGGYVTIWTISYSGSIDFVDNGFGNVDSYIRPVIIVPTSAL